LWSRSVPRDGISPRFNRISGQLHVWLDENSSTSLLEHEDAAEQGFLCIGNPFRAIRFVQPRNEGFFIQHKAALSLSLGDTDRPESQLSKTTTSTCLSSVRGRRASQERISFRSTARKCSGSRCGWNTPETSGKVRKGSRLRDVAEHRRTTHRTTLARHR
jgi:hypothetical protein